AYERGRGTGRGDETGAGARVGGRGATRLRAGWRPGDGPAGGRCRCPGPAPVLPRHLGRPPRRNHNLHQGIYPLGSCTMKYNPVVDEELARLAGFADIHPYQDAGDVQGALQLMWELERLLCEITGMARISLQPAAGAHGEWTGLRMIQAYHAAHG